MIRKLPMIGHSYKVQAIASKAMLPIISAIGTHLGNKQASQTANWNSREVPTSY